MSVPDYPVERRGTVVAVPMYRCAEQIVRVVDKLASVPVGLVDRVLLIDNQSPDGTLEAALRAVERAVWPGFFTVLRNEENYGLGGSHKIAFEHALTSGALQLAIYHGDDQAHLPDLVAMLEQTGSAEGDAVLGGRFSRGAQREGYSRVRTVGNLAFNRIFSLVLRHRVDDLGAGLNVYSADSLRSRYYLRFADDLTFNVHMLVAHALLGQSVRWFPVTWREQDQVSNAKLRSQGLRTLRMALEVAREGRGWLDREHRAEARGSYRSHVVLAGTGVPHGIEVLL